MVHSAAVDVTSYLAEQPADWIPTLERLRVACQDLLDGYDETMSYGMPSYGRNGTVEVAFAKQARYMSLYILKQPVLDAHRGELGGLDLGKGCIRYRVTGQVDWAVVRAMLAETAASSDEVC